MPELLELERIPGLGVMVEISEGERAGELVVLVPRHRGRSIANVADFAGRDAVREALRDSVDRAASETRAIPRVRARTRALMPPRPVRHTASNWATASTARSQASKRAADRLLESLLDDRQLWSWRVSGRFEVPTPFGSVELGELYNLRFRRPGHPDLALCAVPADHLTLPLGDIWTNLLLILRAEPQMFFRTANFRPFDSDEPFHFGPVPL